MQTFPYIPMWIIIQTQVCKYLFRKCFFLFNIAIYFKIGKKDCKLLSIFSAVHQSASIYESKYATIVLIFWHFCLM